MCPRQRGLVLVGWSDGCEQDTDCVMLQEVVKQKVVEQEVVKQEVVPTCTATAVSPFLVLLHEVSEGSLM